MILGIIFLCSFSSAILAQELVQKTERAMIRLIDGSLYVGEVIKDEYCCMTIVILTGDTLKIERHLIRESRGDDRFILHKKGKYHYKQGDIFYGGSLGLWGDADESTGSTMMQFLYGKRFSERWSLAAGFGFEFHSLELAGFPIDTQFGSVFAYGRYYITNSTNRIFAYGRLGMGFAGEESEFASEHTSGFQTQTGLGIHFASRKTNRFTLSFGWHTQKTSGQESFLDDFGNEIRTDFDVLISTPVLKFGFEMR